MNTRNAFALALLAHALISEPLVAQTVEFQWARSASGAGLDQGQKVASDSNGNVYVTGFYTSDTLSFGSIDLTKEPGLSGSSAIFLAKYDASGNVLWARSAGGNEDDIANGIATDADGNVCITGGFQSDSITFDATTLYNASTGSSEDVFVVKYDPDGNLLWARSGAGAGGTPRDVGNAIVVDGNGNVYACGYFRSVSIAFGLDTLTGVGQADVFIVKYDANGNVLWARREGGGGGDVCSGLAADASGNIYAAGQYYSNPLIIGNDTLPNVNNWDDLFIAKYDPDGNPVWAKGAHGNGDDQIAGLATDQSGNVVATGWFETFPITFGTDTIPNSGTKDLFIVKYAPNGDLLWAAGVGGSPNEESSAVATDETGNIYVTGQFRTSLTFDSITINGDLGTNVFIAKYDADGNALWALSAGGVVDERGNGIAVDSVDSVIVTGSFDSPSLPFGPDTLSNPGPYDVFIAKLGPANGNSVVENDLSAGIRVSPNPFSDRTAVRTAAPLTNATLTVINELGQTVKVIRNVRGSEVLVFRDDLPEGLYILQIRQGDKRVASEKILIMD